MKSHAQKLEHRGDPAAVYYKAQKIQQKPEPPSIDPQFDDADMDELMRGLELDCSIRDLAGLNPGDNSNDAPSQVDQMNIDAASTVNLDDFYINDVNGNANFFLTDATNINDALNAERQSDTYKLIATWLSSSTNYNDPNEVYIDPSNGSRMSLSNDKLLRARISQWLDVHMMQN